MQVDRPTRHDALGRAPFARRLANLITAWNGDESLVLGLFGPWGSGKTTVVHLLEMDLESRSSEESPIIVRFNPWEWNAQGQLTAVFFAELAGQLHGARDKTTKDLSRRLLNYGVLLTVATSIAKSAEITSALTAPVLTPIFKHLGDALSRSSEVTKSASEFAVGEKSLLAIKRELRDALAKQRRNILVILDDVDRLTSAETGELFQLIKANADFPRLVYLVVCDPTAVESALDELVNGKGADFLQKIVQVPFHLPQLLSRQREQMLNAGVLNLLRRIGLSDRLNNERWHDAYDEAVETYFTTPRDVVRYLDAVEFTIGDLATAIPREFDVVDFLLLEILRLYERPLYEQLPLHKPELTGRALFYPAEKAKEFISQLLARTAPRRPAAAEVIIRELFPQFGTTGYRTVHGQRINPVSAYESFDRYFFFAMPDTEFTDAELATIMRSCGNAEELLQHLRNARASGRLPALLGTFFDDEDALAPETASAFLTAIACLTPEIDPHEETYRYSIANLLSNLGWRALKEIPASDRDAAFLSLFQSSFAPVLGLYMLESESELPVTENGMPRALKAMNKWTAAAAEADALLNIPNGAVFIKHWRTEDREAAERYLERVCGSPGLVARFLTLFVFNSIVDVHRPRKRHGSATFQMPLLRETTDVSRLAPIVRKLRLEDLSAQERQAVDLFLQAASDL